MSSLLIAAPGSARARQQADARARAVEFAAVQVRRTPCRCARARSPRANHARGPASTSRASAGMSASSQSLPFDEAADVRARVDLHLLGADDRPTSFGLDPSHDRVRRRVAMAHPVAVRHLEETVARRHRAEGDRLEENVVTRVAHELGEEAPGDDQAHDVARPVPDLVELPSRYHFCTGESRM